MFKFNDHASYVCSSMFGMMRCVCLMTLLHLDVFPLVPGLSPKDSSVTLRERDTMWQIRLQLSLLGELLRCLCKGSESWQSAFQRFPHKKSLGTEAEFTVSPRAIVRQVRIYLSNLEHQCSRFRLVISGQATKSFGKTRLEAVDFVLKHRFASSDCRQLAAAGVLESEKVRNGGSSRSLVDSYVTKASLRRRRQRSCV